jgi:hypothetical protein
MQYRRIECQSSNGNYFIHRALQSHLYLAVSSVKSQLKNVLQKTANIKNLGGVILLSDLAVTSLTRLCQFAFAE